MRLWTWLDAATLRPWWWALVALGDLALSVAIVRLVPYTEIDWVAYMQEVEGPLLHDEWDYTQLRGDTGPLVYPAGFVYIFAALRWATDGGTNIRRAQYVFAALHALVVFLVMGTVYHTPASVSVSASDDDDEAKEASQAAEFAPAPVSAPAPASAPAPTTKSADRVPFWVGGLLVASRRVHSIFALRLFNDGVAMALMYLCAFLLVRRRWTLGCAVFSLAFSVKMNIVLFAPGLGVLLLESGGLRKTALQALMCLAMQLALAAPFLRVNARGYVERAFELGRVFTFKWTVNFKFLPEDVFVDPRLAAALLACTLLSWLAFGQRHFAARHVGGLWGLLRSSLAMPLAASPAGPSPVAHAVTVLFTSNFIGIVFCRSMHFQFYCWYYHTLGFLAWRVQDSLAHALALTVLIELCYNVYPAKPWSSALLQLCHLYLLARLWRKSPQCASQGAPIRSKKDR